MAAPAIMGMNTSWDDSVVSVGGSESVPVAVGLMVGTTVASLDGEGVL